MKCQTANDDERSDVTGRKRGGAEEVNELNVIVMAYILLSSRPSTTTFLSRVNKFVTTDNRDDSTSSQTATVLL